MALTNKGAKWENKNSLYTLFALVPGLNCFAFFHMHARVPNKKWVAIGWITLIVNVALITCFCVGNEITNPNERPYYSQIEACPEMKDYLTQAQMEEHNKYDSAQKDYLYSDEYKQYEADLKAYEQRQKEWEQTPVIAQKLENYRAWEDTKDSVLNVIFPILAVFNIFIFVFVLVERPKYLRALAKKTDTSDIAARLRASEPAVPSGEVSAVQTKSAQPTEEKTVDINSATEEEIASLQGLTIIDAKKAIAYREEHGGFRNADEFFTCIHLKPHLILLAEKQIVVGDYAQKKAESTVKHESSKRTIDL